MLSNSPRAILVMVTTDSGHVANSEREGPKITHPRLLKKKTEKNEKKSQEDEVFLLRMNETTTQNKHSGIPNRA